MEWPTLEGQFFDVDEIKTQTYKTQKMSIEIERILYTMDIGLANTKIVHQRSAYNILDLIGDLGGVFEIILFALSVFIGPFSEFSFNIKAL